MRFAIGMEGNGVSFSVPLRDVLPTDMPGSRLTDMPGSPLTPLRVDAPPGNPGRPEPAEDRALSWGQTALAIVVAVVLIGLGVANIATRARLHEVEDGVLWVTRAEGVTAVEVAPGAAGAGAGRERGGTALSVTGH